MVLSVIARVALFVAGAWVVLWIVRSALWTVVVPRAEQVWLTRFLFLTVRRPFEWAAKRAGTVTRREAIRARYGPTTLMLMPVAWVLGVWLGFVPIYWALGADPVSEEFVLSGSSVTTLGFSRPNEGPPLAAAVVQALIGLGLVALLISFLPTMYGHFSRREHLVAKLSSRAGTPPTPAELFIRHHRLEKLEQIDDMWPDWEDWFIQLEESHTTYPALVHFRSIDDHRSWLTAAGALLDAAALRASTLDLPRQSRAELTIRSGYLALRSIADFFGFEHDRRPQPDDPIAVHRAEFDGVYEQLRAAGVPLKPDRGQCWRDFAGWRVNYDRVLLELCGLVQPPPGLWSSDRMAELGPYRFPRPPRRPSRGVRS
ncbi:MAG TPA: hypothetical protein VD926_06785 [Acidimicrobiales bacterium]|nr:hypothetical protein [Acidimicrobiales bacterium]